MPLILNGTTGVSGIDGSAGTPSYVGGDSDTGVWFPAADTIAFTTNGTEDMRISSNGVVSIGTTINNGARLIVFDSNAAIVSQSSNGTLTLRSAANTSASNAVELHVRPSSGKGGYVSFTEDSVADRFTIGVDAGVAALLFKSGTYNGTERMRITSGGDVGIGTNSPSYKIDVVGNVNDGVISRVYNLNSGSAASARFYAENNSNSLVQLATFSSGFGFNVFGINAANYSSVLTSGSSSNGLLVGTTTSDPIIFGTNGTEAMRISSGQQVGIGKSPAVTLDVNGAFNYDPNVTTNGISVVYRATFNDGVNRELGAGWANTFGMVTIKATGGNTNIPFFGNGGGGVAYAATAFDPDAGTWSYGAGPTITFTTSGTGGNTFVLAFKGGSGLFDLQRTAGSGSFTVVIQHFTT